MCVLRNQAILGAALVLALCATVTPAWATGWTLPVENPVVVLAYGVRYAGGVHRGLDLGSWPGADVAAPAPGTVIFAGQVPADGGGTCGAVTIQLADGSKTCLLPLDSLFAVTGDVVAGGKVVGTLAAAGDDSSAGSHLHLSLRQGTAYLDPTALLSIASGESADAPPLSSGEAQPADQGAQGEEASMSDEGGSGPAGSGAPAADVAVSEAPQPTAPTVTAAPHVTASATARHGGSSLADHDAPAAPAPQASIVRRDPVESAGVPRTSSLESWVVSEPARSGPAVSWTPPGAVGVAALAAVVLAALAMTSRQVAASRVE